ncbi:hypothetical protein [Rhizobium sp. SL42]|uniref:hypothetical protein n=1 Tax=Rhizobium sp. SL42 TaxID=2806346 RepID=UPI001F40657F|nr:hypothetical protein [Rhizobium sp. SL42]UJW74760.1 hypothetical protein IM739_18145 [Rhizobium sp. SL42]
MPDAELTAPAREAIRKFVWQTVAPSGLAIAIFSAAAGFVVKDWAISHGNKQLEEKVQAEIDSAQEKLNVALRDADVKLTELYNTRDKIQANNVALAVTSSKIESDLESIRRAIPIIESLNPAQLVRLNELLQMAVAGSADVVTADKPAAIPTENKSMDWENFIQSVSNGSADKAGIGEGSSSRCPSGAFAVGFNLLTSPGGPHGIVYGGTVICREFPRG